MSTGSLSAIAKEEVSDEAASAAGGGPTAVSKAQGQ